MSLGVISTAIARSTNSTSVTSGSIDTTGANLIVVAVNTYSVTTPTFTDSAGNTWTSLTSQGSGQARSQIFYCFDPTTSSTHTFSISGGTIYPAVAVIALSGAAAFDQENGASGSGSGSVAPGSMTPTEDDEIVVSTFSDSNVAGSVTATPSGFTTLGALNATSLSEGIDLAYQIQTAAAARNPTWTFGSGQTSWAATGATFTAAGGGDPTTAFVDPAVLELLGVAVSVATETKPSPALVDFQGQSPSLSSLVLVGASIIDFVSQDVATSVVVSVGPAIIEFSGVSLGGQTISVLPAIFELVGVAAMANTSIRPDPAAVDFQPQAPSFRGTVFAEPSHVDFAPVAPSLATSVFLAAAAVDFVPVAPTFSVRVTADPAVIEFAGTAVSLSTIVSAGSAVIEFVAIDVGGGTVPTFYYYAYFLGGLS